VRTLLVILLVALSVSACGSGGAETKSQPSNVPQRIVSLSPTATEMLFSVGAGQQIVAVDEDSAFPASAPQSSMSGARPDAKAVISFKPDLVVLSADVGGIRAALEKAGVNVLIEPPAESLDDSYAQLASLGTATGHAAQGRSAAADMKSRIDAAVAMAPKNTGLTYFHERTPSLDTVTSTAFLGKLYGMFGLKNVADSADKTNSGYPRLSTEALISADPRLIFLGDARSASAVAKRPGWAGLTAVRTKSVYALNGDLIAGWGPRLSILATEIGDAVKKSAAQKAPA
jgi:iron complex transport system substrate-binding protein